MEVYVDPKVVALYEEAIKRYHKSNYPNKYVQLNTVFCFDPVKSSVTYKDHICFALFSYQSYRNLDTVGIAFRYANHFGGAFKYAYDTDEMVDKVADFYRWIIGPDSPWREMFNKYETEVVYTSCKKKLPIGIVLSCDIPANLLVNFCIGSRFAIEKPKHWAAMNYFQKEYTIHESWILAHFFSYIEESKKIVSDVLAYNHIATPGFIGKNLLSRRFNEKFLREPFKKVSYHSSEQIWYDDEVGRHIPTCTEDIPGIFLKLYKEIEKDK